MSDNKQKILEMLDAKKISVEEAMKLLEAVDRPENTASGTPRPAGRTIKYLRVLVDSPHGQRDQFGRECPAKVNIRVPVALIRAGMKFKSLLPTEASDKIDRALREKGIDINLKNIKDEDIEQLIQALSEIEVDVDSGDKVRVFAE